MNDEKNERKSLLDLFYPPDEKHKGVFGLLCALSADKPFVDSILERFSTQRMYPGHLSMALFLDCHNEPITNLLGLCWAYPDERKWKEKTKLQHAKVALLGFGESNKKSPDYYRLIVFTGNWTNEAVNSSINLAWYCDYDTASSENQKQEASDICEAVDFWWKLLGNDGNGGYYKLAKSFRDRITEFLNDISKDVIPPERGYPPRFVSNLLNTEAKKEGDFKENSMGAQFIKFIDDNETSRNFICCGSGFFEQTDKENFLEEPEVLKQLVDVLKKKDRLAKNISEENKWIVINPETSGALGEWIKNTHEDDLTWFPRQSKHPDKDGAYFHAKYIFIANKRNDSYSNGLLYLGSGNLSKQGFALGPGTNGNIEAGVFLTISDSIKEESLCEKLGIDPDNPLNKELITENSGEEAEQELTEIQPSPPIISCKWNRETRLLTWEDSSDTCWEEIKINNTPIDSKTKEIVMDVNYFSIKLEAKLAGKLYRWDIPVFNKNGDFCSPPIQPKSMPEILDMIRNFPVTYEEEEEEEDNMNDPVED
ncbi:MAG: hypothetical protein FJ266_10600, partial [Planctomycetes bacterium]|nr:hypothetical protein [Planctomycetota bacterium]